MELSELSNPPLPPPPLNLNFRKGFDVHSAIERENQFKLINDHVEGYNFIFQYQNHPLNPNRNLIERPNEDIMERVHQAEERGPLVHILSYLTPVEILLGSYFVNRSFHRTTEFMIRHRLVSKIDRFYGTILFCQSSPFGMREELFVKLISNDLITNDFMNVRIGKYRLMDYILRRGYNEGLRSLLERGVKYEDSENWEYIERRSNVEAVKVLIETGQRISNSMILLLGYHREFEYIKKLCVEGKLNSVFHRIGARNFHVIYELLREKSKKSKEVDDHLLRFSKWYNEKVDKFSLPHLKYYANLMLTEKGIRNLEYVKFLLRLNYPENKMDYLTSYRLVYTLLCTDKIRKYYLENRIERRTEKFEDFFASTEKESFIQWLVEESTKKRICFEPSSLILYFLEIGDLDTAMKLGLDKEFYMGFSQLPVGYYSLYRRKMSIYDVVELDEKILGKLVRKFRISFESLCLVCLKTDKELDEERILLLWKYYYHEGHGTKNETKEEKIGQLLAWFTRQLYRNPEKLGGILDLLLQSSFDPLLFQALIFRCINKKFEGYQSFIPFNLVELLIDSFSLYLKNEENDKIKRRETFEALYKIHSEAVRISGRFSRVGEYIERSFPKLNFRKKKEVGVVKKEKKRMFFFWNY